MTAKETRYVRNLEIKIEQLEQALKRSQTTWADQFTAIYETRTALLQSFAAIEEAAVIMHNCIKDDPQYMAERKRIAKERIEELEAAVVALTEELLLVNEHEHQILGERDTARAEVAELKKDRNQVFYQNEKLRRKLDDAECRLDQETRNARRQ